MSKKKKMESATEVETGITLVCVLESGILDEFEISDEFVQMGTRKLGGEWFKDQKSGKAYGIVEDDDHTLRVAEVRESKGSVVRKETRTNITCVDCGAERDIALQDLFQVKRCVDCQKKLRNEKRRTRAKARRAERRKERELNTLNEPKEEEVVVN